MTAEEKLLKEVERLRAENERLPGLEADRRALDELRSDVAHACQSSGTMLTDMQPEAMDAVMHVCQAHRGLADETAAYIWLHSQRDWDVSLYSGGGWLLFDCRAGSGRFSDRIDYSETQASWPTPLEAIAKARELACDGEG